MVAERVSHLAKIAQQASGGAGFKPAPTPGCAAPAPCRPAAWSCPRASGSLGRISSSGPGLEALEQEYSGENPDIMWEEGGWS